MSMTPPVRKLALTAHVTSSVGWLGAVVAFLTPIGHHGNLLILNPGQYRFGDFLRVGVPLTIIISLVCAFLAEKIWLS